MKIYLLMLCTGDYSSYTEYKIISSLDEEKILSLEKSLAKDLVWLLDNKYLFFDSYFSFLSREKENFFQRMLAKQNFSEMTLNIINFLIKENSSSFSFKIVQVDYT
jgi:hypothetical protein